MKYLIVTDTPTPWREKVYEYVHNMYGDEFHVVYCKYNESRRLWKFQLGDYPKTILKSVTTTLKEKERFINIGIIPFILKNRPEIVIWFSFQPTVILALLTSKFIKSKLIVLSDTWLERDRDISMIQKIGRWIAYNFFSDAFIGVSRQTHNMYKFYNKSISTDSLFLSALCADNEYFIQQLGNKHTIKKYDIMFAGRIVNLKNPIFFSEVALKIKKKLGNCSVLVIGDGNENLKNSMSKIFEENSIDYHFTGFIEHKDLPDYYSKSKIFLLPTSGDCWGVVINEAMVAGLPVITTNMTAAAGELVLDGQNGFVLPMDSDLWAEKISRLLNDNKEYIEFSKCARETVANFNFNKAAEGIIASIEYLKNNKCL